MAVLAVTAEDATVYIYRLRVFAASARKMTLSIDGTSLAQLQNGRYIAIKLPVGEHVLSDKKPKVNITFTVEAGRTYYVRSEFIPDGLFGFNTRFSLEQAETGMGDLRRVKADDPSQIKNRAIVMEPR